MLVLFKTTQTFGVVVFHKRTYELCKNIFCVLIITNMETVRNFEVVSCKFRVV